jgi:hypothetical protein
MGPAYALGGANVPHFCFARATVALSARLFAWLVLYLYSPGAVSL